jgi:endonuclease G
MRFILFFFLLPAIVISQDYRVPKGEIAEYRSGFAFKFNEARKISDWVGYTVKHSDVQGDKIGSPLFYKDSLINSCPNPADYNRYGYSEGTLKPPSAARNSSKQMKAINNFVNVAPMDLAFDKGVWRILENLVSGWAVVFDSVHVVTGPIFKNGEPDMIGENKVNVPDAFFKVIMVYNGIDMASIGFIIPNKPDANDLKKYSMPVDSVEFKTGYDFFSDLPDYLEFYMEEKIDPAVWKDKSMSYTLKSSSNVTRRCIASIRSDDRCKILTTCVTQHCWKHGCDVKQD